MKVYTEKKECLIIDDKPFSKGGEGSVFQIPNNPRYCVKIYHNGKRNTERKRKLEYMVLHPPTPLITKQYIICWPVKVIYDKDGDFIGFVMPMAFQDSVLCYEICRMRIDSELGNVWMNYYNRRSKLGLVNRLKLIDNIALPINAIHSMGKYVLVDFKPQNMLITSDGRISIIDLDSIQIKDDNQQFLCPVSTPEYLPPELQHDTRLGTRALDASCDRFALAVIFYQILYGLHPFTVTAQDNRISEIRELIAKGLFPYGRYSHKIKVIPEPHKRFQILPPEVQSLFKHAFGFIPEERPTAETWGVILYDFITKIANYAK